MSVYYTHLPALIIIMLSILYVMVKAPLVRTSITLGKLQYKSSVVMTTFSYSYSI